MAEAYPYYVSRYFGSRASLHSRTVLHFCSEGVYRPPIVLLGSRSGVEIARHGHDTGAHPRGEHLLAK